MSEACISLFGYIVYVPEFEENDWDMYPNVEFSEVAL